MQGMTVRFLAVCKGLLTEHALVLHVCQRVHACANVLNVFHPGMACSAVYGHEAAAAHLDAPCSSERPLCAYCMYHSKLRLSCVL